MPAATSEYPTMKLNEVDIASALDAIPYSGKRLAAIENTCSNAGSQVIDIVTLIKADPLLSAGVLRAANSVVFASTDQELRTENSGNIDYAVFRLGFQLIRQLASLSQLHNITNFMSLDIYNVSVTHFMHNALYGALMAEELGRSVGLSPDKCYHLGLLRNVGMLPLNSFAMKRDRTLRYDRNAHGHVMPWEYKTFGKTRADIGSALVRKWGFGSVEADTLQLYHTPDTREDWVLHIASGYAGKAGHSVKDDTSWEIQKGLANFNINPADAQAFVAYVNLLFRRIANIV